MLERIQRLVEVKTTIQFSCSSILSPLSTLSNPANNTFGTLFYCNLKWAVDVSFSVIAFVMRSIESFETPLAAVSIQCLQGNGGIHRRSLRNLAIESDFLPLSLWARAISLVLPTRLGVLSEFLQGYLWRQGLLINTLSVFRKDNRRNGHRS